MIKLGEDVSPIILPFVFEKIEDVFSVKPKRKRNTPSRKCALPGCENMTRHKGGYCCAEHKNMHKHKAVEELL